MIVDSVKYLILGILLLFLFHFESLSIGPMKVSLIWKGFLLTYLIIVLTRGAKIKPYLYGSLLLLAFLQIINIELINNTFNAILLFSTTLIIPLLGIYVFRFTFEQINKGLLFFASFFILCFTPYKLGLLSSINSGYELTSYGFESSGLIGPFQTVHSASTALAGALLVVVFFLFTNAYSKIYLSFLLLLGTYFLFSTYVRTGMLMFILGLIPIIFHFGKKNSKSFLKLLAANMIASIVLVPWILSNEALMDRITGKRVNQSEFDSVEDLGSGRGSIYISAVEIYIEANLLEKIFGVGQAQEKIRMEKKIGHGLIPHNGFLLILLNNGVIGIVLFLTFLMNIYRCLLTYKSESVVLLKALFLAYIVMTFFQNFDMLYEILLLFLSIALTVKHSNKFNYENFNKYP